MEVRWYGDERLVSMLRCITRLMVLTIIRFGTYSAAESIKAGLDMEMPGPPSARGKQITLALNCGKLTEHDLDTRLRNILNLINKVTTVLERSSTNETDSSHRS